MNNQPHRRTKISSRDLWIALPAVAAISAFTLTACSSDNSDDQSSGKVSTINVTLDNSSGADACTLDTDSVPAGPVTFKVTNKSAPGITEIELLQDQRILGEKENLAPGLPTVQFTSTLDGGKYNIYCPGGKQEHVEFTVTGAAAPTPSGSVQSILAAGTTEYAGYVNSQIGLMVTAVGELNQKIQAGDLQGARAAYAKARPYYERAESAIAGFVLPGFAADNNAGSLDYLIDMRTSTPVDNAVGWKGFHAIERDLFQGNKIDQSTKNYSTELVANVGKLKGVAATLTYKPEDLANGAADLIEEVQNNKITGSEEEFSHVDLVDFAGNVEGAQQAYASLRPGLQKMDPALVTKIDGQFNTVLTTLNTYRDPNGLGGYKLYTAALKAADAAKLQAVIAPLHASLATLAEKVASAG